MTQYNDVPFVPSQDCSRWEECQEEAYKQGRADAIDEYRDMLLKECIETPNECWNLECPFADDVCRIITVSEQLKEQENE